MTARLHDAPVQPVPTDADIYERILGAVLDHRPAPGTRLIEEKLGRAFGVSRTRIRIRQVLVRLAAEQVVVLAHNRGASPCQQDAHEVFVAQAADAELARLVCSLAEEETANQAGDRCAASRHEHAQHEGCGCEVHAALVGAIRARDARNAARLMKRHLKQLLENIAFDREPVAGADIEQLFRRG